MRTDLSGCDAFAATAEDEACDQVDPAQNEDDHTGTNDDTPERQAERLLAGSWLVEITEHVGA